MRMTRKVANQPLTLSDADITSQRVTRRSLLGALGLGAGVAAAATFGVAETAHADTKTDGKKKAPAKKPVAKKAPAKKKEETDAD
jgi:hypothetical protein